MHKEHMIKFGIDLAQNFSDLLKEFMDLSKSYDQSDELACIILLLQMEED